MAFLTASTSMSLGEEPGEGRIGTTSRTSAERLAEASSSPARRPSGTPALLDRAGFARSRSWGTSGSCLSLGSGACGVQSGEATQGRSMGVSSYATQGSLVSKRSTNSEKGPRMSFLAPKCRTFDLMFYRRFFSQMNRRYGNGQDEIPLTVFRNSFLQLFRILGMKHVGFDPRNHDINGSGTIGWWEFASTWQEASISVNLGVAERWFYSMEDPNSSILGRIQAVVVMSLIVLSSAGFILSTMAAMRYHPEGCPTCEPETHNSFVVLEHVCAGIFSVEYATKFLSAPFARMELLDNECIVEMVVEFMEPMSRSPLRRLVSWMIKPMNVVDLLAILPFWVELITGGVYGHLMVLRVVRLTRLVRLLKLGRYFEVLQVMGRVLTKSAHALQMLLCYLMLAVCFSASLMYLAEEGTWDPETRTYLRRASADEDWVHSPFQSIPDTFWWCFVTYTTTGYGDQYPITLTGKLVAGATMLIGILVIAMPISVISSNFDEVWIERYEEKRLEEESRVVDMRLVDEAIRVQGGPETAPFRTLLLELWDDDGYGRRSEFLGEVELLLPVLEDKMTEQIFDNVALQENFEKQRRKVTGTVSLGISWTPDDVPPEDCGAEGVFGELKVVIVNAVGLLHSEWKSSEGKSDPFAVAIVFPTPPDAEGAVHGETFRTQAINSVNPDWNEEASFRFAWPWSTFKNVRRIVFPEDMTNTNDCPSSWQRSVSERSVKFADEANSSSLEKFDCGSTLQQPRSPTLARGGVSSTEILADDTQTDPRKRRTVAHSHTMSLEAAGNRLSQLELQVQELAQQLNHQGEVIEVIVRAALGLRGFDGVTNTLGLLGPSPLHEPDVGVGTSQPRSCLRRSQDGETHEEQPFATQSERLRRATTSPVPASARHEVKTTRTKRRALSAGEILTTRGSWSERSSSGVHRIVRGKLDGSLRRPTGEQRAQPDRPPPITL